MKINWKFPLLSLLLTYTLTFSSISLAFEFKNIIKDTTQYWGNSASKAKEKSKQAIGKIAPKFKKILDKYFKNVNCIENCEIDNKLLTMQAEVFEREAIRFEIAFTDFLNTGATPRLVVQEKGITLREKIDYPRKVVEYTILAKEFVNKSEQTKELTINLKFLIPKLLMQNDESFVTKEYRLHLLVKNANRAPLLSVPNYVDIIGAANGGWFSASAADPDGEEVTLECDAKKNSNGEYFVEDETNCTAYDGDKNDPETLWDSKTVQLRRNNTAPQILLPEELYLNSLDGRLEVIVHDQENDPIQTTCLFNEQNICPSGIIDSEQFPLNKESNLLIRSTDGILVSNKIVSIKHTTNLDKEISLVLMPNGNYVGNIIQNEESMELIESNLSSIIFNAGRWTYVVYENYKEGLFAKFKIGEHIVNYKFNVSSADDLNILKTNAILAQNSTNYKRELSIDLPFSPQCQNCIRLYDDEKKEINNFAYPHLQMELKENSFVISVLWNDLPGEKNDSFYLQLDKQIYHITLKILRPYPSILLNGSPLRENAVIKFTEGDSLSLNFSLEKGESFSSIYQEISIIGLNDGLIIFDADSERPVHQITMNNILNKTVGLVKRAGLYRPVMRFTTKNGIKNDFTFSLKILPSAVPAFGVSFLNLRNLQGNTSVKIDQIFNMVNESNRIFAGWKKLVVASYEEIDIHDDSNERLGNDYYINDNSAAPIRPLYNGKKTVILSDLRSITKKYIKNGTLPIFLANNLLASHGSIVGVAILTVNGIFPNIVLGNSAYDSTLAHEIGHTFTLQHPFHAEDNPSVTLCSLKEAEQKSVCEKSSITGNIVFPEKNITVEPLSGRPLTGDGIDDTTLDGYGVSIYKNYCYATTFGQQGQFASKFFCSDSAPGIFLANASSSEKEQKDRSEAVCWKERDYREKVTLKCQYGFADDDSDTRIGKNIMGYWRIGNDLFFTQQQKIKMDQAIADQNLVLANLFATGQ